MFNYILNGLFNLTVEVFVWGVLWRVGVPVNYLALGICTTFILKGLYKLERSITTYARSIMKEQILQTRALCKIAEVDETEMVNTLKNDLTKAYKNAAN